MCERIIKIICEKRREYIKEFIVNPLLTHEEYKGLVLKIKVLNEILILNKIEEQNINKNDIIIA
jgi:Trp operon repressor